MSVAEVGKLYHHDGRAYEQAARETQEKFEAMMNKGGGEAGSIIDKILSETPVDYIAPVAKTRFTFDDDARLLMHLADKVQLTVHDNAARQFCSWTGLPFAYVQQLLSEGEWGMTLLLRNLNDLAAHDPKRALVRTVGGESRGWLSDRYRRLDAKPIIESFVAACQKVGARPFGGFHTDLRNGVRAIVPQLFLVGDVPMAFGAELTTSDFGKGALGVRLLKWSAWCSNMAITENTYRKVHIGRRIEDDFAFSQETYELDSKTVASAIRDVVEASLSPEACEAQIETMTRANRSDIDGKTAKEILKDKLSKKEAEEVVELFAMNANRDEVPERGANYARLSSCVSWLAQSAEDAERKVELEEVAGWLIDSGAKKAA